MTNKRPRLRVNRIFVLVFIGLFAFQANALENTQTTTTNQITTLAVDANTPNSTCIECHGASGFAVPNKGINNQFKRELSFDTNHFSDSAHGKQSCVSCHTDITEMPHRDGVERTVDCQGCHQDLAHKTQEQTQQLKLDKVIEKTDVFLASIHAQPNKDDPSKPNATCTDCHNAHFIFPMDSKESQAFRMSTPQVCGDCHQDVLDSYNGSVHGIAVNRFENKASAVCADCHIAHSITNVEEESSKVLITQNCGGCHTQEYETYMETYHGQVNKLGYAHTAKCYDCHEHHDTVRVDDPVAKMHKDNRLETCQTCHKDATEGYTSFYAHGNTHDFDKYPLMYLTSKFMIGLLFSVFAFFWLHSALWFYREWQDKKQGKKHVYVNKAGEAVAIRHPEKTHVKRFSMSWRIIHLLVALSIMALTLTGTAVMFADSVWAPWVMKMLGGPAIAAIIHRVAAAVLCFIFITHVMYVLWHLLVTKRKTFKWFGTSSLLPNLQDGRDIIAMFKWFFGKAPRPVFDHWTYWEKFDYWAPFWGMFIIGISGAMLWAKDFTATYLPGWVFNIATILHGEEAFLAAVFLFSVHFFNCHFRPDKFPQDIVIFTGSMPLHEFIEERTIEYERLVADGTLENVLVEPPSKAETFWSKVISMTLIIIGLILLAFVLIGFSQSLF